MPTKASPSVCYVPVTGGMGGICGKPQKPKRGNPNHLCVDHFDVGPDWHREYLVDSFTGYTFSVIVPHRIGPPMFPNDYGKEEDEAPVVASQPAPAGPHEPEILDIPDDF